MSDRPARWRAFRRAPLVVQALLLVTTGLLLASLFCVAAELPTPGNVVVGTFGAVATVLGLIVAADLRHAADAVAEIARTFRPGTRRAERPVRGVRVLAVYYVVFGIVLTVAGYGGFIHWHR
jgi:membrane-bound ClpP family serine protease